MTRPLCWACLSIMVYSDSDSVTSVTAGMWCIGFHLGKGRGGGWIFAAHALPPCFAMLQFHPPLNDFLPAVRGRLCLRSLHSWCTDPNCAEGHHDGGVCLPMGCHRLLQLIYLAVWCHIMFNWDETWGGHLWATYLGTKPQASLPYQWVALPGVSLVEH